MRSVLLFPALQMKQMLDNISYNRQLESLKFRFELSSFNLQNLAFYHNISVFQIELYIFLEMFIISGLCYIFCLITSISIFVFSIVTIQHKISLFSD